MGRSIRPAIPSCLVSALIVAAASGCAVVQKIDSAIDCNGICGRYAACFDKKYDVSACAMPRHCERRPQLPAQG